MQRKGGETVLNNAAHFTLDWHHIGLPIISVRSEEDPIEVFRSWLRNIIVLSPSPSQFQEMATLENADLERCGETILDWAHGILSNNPSLYNNVSRFLKERMPDFEVFKFETVGREKELWFTFSGEDNSRLRLNFIQLSDGEKIFFLAGILLSALQGDLPVVCLWDEPDHFISLPELGHFVTTCRRGFENDENNSQLIITSHNERVLNEFSEHNTFVLSRPRHTAPTRLTVLSDKSFVSARVVDAYENGELD
jgi:predicted ATPase